LLFNANGLDTSYYNIIKALSKYKLHDNGSNINNRQSVQSINTAMKRERERKNKKGVDRGRERGGIYVYFI